jgi:hypothetical protein
MNDIFIIGGHWHCFDSLGVRSTQLTICGDINNKVVVWKYIYILLHII